MACGHRRVPGPQTLSIGAVDAKTKDHVVAYPFSMISTFLIILEVPPKSPPCSSRGYLGTITSEFRQG